MRKGIVAGRPLILILILSITASLAGCGPGGNGSVDGIVYVNGVAPNKDMST
jgi:hypothetical protein